MKIATSAARALAFFQDLKTLPVKYDLQIVFDEYKWSTNYSLMALHFSKLRDMTKETNVSIVPCRSFKKKV